MLPSGTLLGNYEIVDLLASGGMGQVYVAQDSKLERRIALKVLPADMASDPERLERFEREAKVVASLNHPNIVTIHSVEEAEGPDGDTLHFITMELVEGKTLDREIPHGGLPIDRFFAIAVPLADAVGAAHHKGITHRDLKPGNVMFTGDGRLKVLDFGLAKLAQDMTIGPATDPTAATAATVAAAPITEEGKVLGTVAYMSPEQAEGKPVDNRSDIFSLGIILYEMVTGALPFTGDTKMSLMSSIIKDTPVSVTDVKRELPNHLGRIVRRCLEKDPERRFQSALDVRNDLAGLKEEIDSGEVVTTQSSIDAMRAGSATDRSSMAEAGDTSSPGAAPADPARVSGPEAPVRSDPSGPIEATTPATEPAAPAPASATASRDPSQQDPSHRSTASGEAPAYATGGGGLLSNKPALLGVGAVVMIVVALGAWLLSGGTDAGSSGASVDTGTAGAAEGVADHRPSVAVLYFDNLSGDESLDWLRTGLTDLLVTDLSQTPELRVLTTDALYEILDESDNLEARTTSAAVVRTVAEQGDVDHVVVGSFIRAGDTFRISARLQDPSSGETLAAETVEGIGEDSIFGSVDDLTRRIRDRLAVPVSTAAVVDRDLSDVTTSSMNAYRFYTDGVNLISQNRYQEAIPMFERALEIDPEFAMAWAKMSIVHRNIFDFDAARVYAERAIENADRLTQRERFYIEGRYYAQDPETTLQSIEAYENALALYPDDSASRNNVALEYSELEQYDRTIEHFEELLRRGTPFLPSYFNAAIAYVNNGQCDRGFELMRDFVRNQPDYHFGFRDLAGVALLCGRYDEAEAALATYDEGVEAGQPADVLDGQILFQLHILRDEFDEALAANERLAASSSPAAQYFAYPGHRIVVAGYRGTFSESIGALAQLAEELPDDAGPKPDMFADIAEIYLSVDEVGQALVYADRAEALAQRADTGARAAALTAIAQARAGRSVAARTAAQQHDRMVAQFPNPWARRRELLVDAELALSQEQIEEAVEYLEQAYDLLPPGPDFSVFDPFVRYAFALAEAQYRAGNLLRAAELFTAVIEAESQRIYHPYAYVRSFFYLGQIAERDGDNAAARRYYQRFLDYWGEGAIDRDRVTEARAFVNGD